MIIKKVHGCLLGGAIGDALGMPFEEMPTSLRMQLYGDKKIHDFVPSMPYMLRQETVQRRQRNVPFDDVSPDDHRMTGVHILRNLVLLLERDDVVGVHRVDVDSRLPQIGDVSVAAAARRVLVQDGLAGSGRGHQISKREQHDKR